jgi:hypothetical protein
MKTCNTLKQSTKVNQNLKFQISYYMQPKAKTPNIGLAV